MDSAPISSPDQPDPEPRPIFSTAYIIFTILLITVSVVGGLIQTGKLSVAQLTGASKPVVSPTPAAIATPAPTPKPGTFVITSISLGRSSYAIINGISRAEGAPVEAKGVTGWKVSRIMDGGVLLKNGSVIYPIRMSLPDIRPLDDSLHPLN